MINHEKSSPGPWEFKQPDAKNSCRLIIDGNGETIMGDEQYYPWCPDSDADWELIARAPSLQSQVERLREAAIEFMQAADAIPGKESIDTEKEMNAVIRYGRARDVLHHLAEEEKP